MVSAAIGHRSRTITRTISTHQALNPFGQLRLLVEASTSRPRSLSRFRRGRRGPRERWEAKLVSAVLAEHDSVGHLLESRCAAATSEVLEALRERASRSIEDADVIERKGLAGFAAPLDSFLSVAAHAKLGNSHSLLYSQVGRFGGKSTGVLPGGLGLCHDAGRIQHFPAANAELSTAVKLSLLRIARRYSPFLSDYLPDVLPQVSAHERVAADCPRGVRVS
jgi:hypothetical protein